MKLKEGEVGVTLTKDWQIKNNVRIPKGIELAVSQHIERQLEAAKFIENRERTVEKK